MQQKSCDETQGYPFGQPRLRLIADGRQTGTRRRFARSIRFDLDADLRRSNGDVKGTIRTATRKHRRTCQLQNSGRIA